MKWTSSRCTAQHASFMESMGKQLNSSGIFPRIYNIADLIGDPERLAMPERGTRTILWQDHIHVNVQRHWMGKEKYWGNLYFEFGKSKIVRTAISGRPPDVYRTWKWNEVVWYQELQTWRHMEFHSSKNGTELQGDQAPCHHEYQCFESWNSTTKYRENIHTPQRWIDEFRIVVQDKILCESALSTYGAVSSSCYQYESREGEQPRVSLDQEKNINQGYWWTVCKQEKCNPWYVLQDR